MKKSHLNIISLMLLQLCLIPLLFSCGGDASSNNAKIWRPPSEKLCQQILSNSLSVNDVDLSNQQEVDIQQMLEMVSPAHGYQLFLKDKKDFMAWITEQKQTVEVAIHETNHQIDALAPTCSESQYARYFLNGQFHITSIFGSETENYSIIEQILPEYLKARSVYKIYIAQNQTNSSKNFTILLDELTAYVGDSQFQIDFLNSGLISDQENYFVMGNIDIDEVVDMMLYLEYYLKVVRLDYSASYTAINEPATVKVIQYLWQQAEETLHKAYPYIVELDDELKTHNSGSPFFTGFGDYLPTLEILKAVYSDDALFELDQLGIAHETLNDWQDTYLTYDQQ